MRNAVVIPIDGDKLRACLAIKNYGLKEASKAMGFGGSYFNQVISRGTITPYGAKLVESELGISLDMYKVEEVEDVPKEQPSPNSEIVSELREIKELLRQILEVWS